MKKSEFIENVTNRLPITKILELAQNFNHNSVEKSKELKREIISEMIDLFEDEGMEPPQVDVEYFEGVEYNDAEYYWE